MLKQIIAIEIDKLLDSDNVSEIDYDRRKTNHKKYSNQNNDAMKNS
jgi:hypothetical protein